MSDPKVLMKWINGLEEKIKCLTNELERLSGENHLADIALALNKIVYLMNGGHALDEWEQRALNAERRIEEYERVFGKRAGDAEFANRIDDVIEDIGSER